MIRYFLLFERSGAGFSFTTTVSGAVVGAMADVAGLARSFPDYRALETALEKAGIGPMLRDQALLAIRSDIKTFIEVDEEQAINLDVLRRR